MSRALQLIESITPLLELQGSYDLQKEFDDLNGSLFDNELENIVLKWGPHKNALGITTAKVQRHNPKDKKDIKVISPITISISSLFDMERNDFIAILAHEMIHAWLIQNGRDENHSSAFKAKAKELSKKLKVPIAATHDASAFKVAATAKPKKVGYILIRDQVTKNVSLALFTLNAWDTFQKDHVAGFSSKLAAKFEVLDAGVRELRIANLFKIQRKASDFPKFYRLQTDEQKREFEDLLK